MNFYLNTELTDILSNYISGDKHFMAVKDKYFVTNVEDLIQSAVEAARAETKKDLELRPALRNKQIVKELYKKGIFDLKDAVLKVANCMGISKNTVYMHLRNLHEEEGR
jgi:predicted transcriptional regulator YheO